MNEIQLVAATDWRRGRDLNPRYGCPYAAFRVRCFQPLSHLSKGAATSGENPRARMAEPDNMRRRAGSSATVAQGSKILTTQKDGGRVAFSAELNIVRLAGGVAEWLKAHAWKVCIRETVSRVRIPPPPPLVFYIKTIT